NVAEYRALIAGLEVARQKGVDQIEVVLDSVLLVEQMKGAYKVKSPALKPLHQAARTLADEFRRIDFVRVPRGENSAADALANRGIDEWLKENPRPSPPERAQGELF
ncbi:MAG: ribonuclease HI family protein, partial [Actinomycetota bacterium]